MMRLIKFHIGIYTAVLLHVGLKSIQDKQKKLAMYYSVV